MQVVLIISHWEPKRVEAEEALKYWQNFKKKNFIKVEIWCIEDLHQTMREKKRVNGHSETLQTFFAAGKTSRLCSEMCNYLQWDGRQLGERPRIKCKRPWRKHLLQAITFCQGCQAKSKWEVQMKGPVQDQITKHTHKITCPTSLE